MARYTFHAIQANSTNNSSQPDAYPRLTPKLGIPFPFPRSRLGLISSPYFPLLPAGFCGVDI